MFKKPFKGPEERKCKYCGELFIAKRPQWKCSPCVNKEQIERSRFKKEMGLISNKKPYPYNDFGPVKRFRKVKRELKRLDFREDWQEYFRNKLDELLQDRPLMEWITDRRDSQTLNEKRNKRYGIAATIVKHKYPDTRQMND